MRGTGRNAIAVISAPDAKASRDAKARQGAPGTMGSGRVIGRSGEELKRPRRTLDALGGALRRRGFIACSPTCLAASRSRRTTSRLVAVLGGRELDHRAPPRALAPGGHPAANGKEIGDPRQPADRLGFLAVPLLWGFPGTPQAQAVALPTRTHRYPESPYGFSPLGSLLRSPAAWDRYRRYDADGDRSNGRDQPICRATCRVAAQRMSDKTRRASAAVRMWVIDRLANLTTEAWVAHDLLAARVLAERAHLDARATPRARRWSLVLRRDVRWALWHHHPLP